MDTYTGTTGDDELDGTSNDDTFLPLTGTDTVHGNGGNDTLIVDYTTAASGGFYGRVPDLIDATNGTLSGSLSTFSSSDSTRFDGITNIQFTANTASDFMTVTAAALAVGGNLTLDSGGGDYDEISLDFSQINGLSFTVAGPAVTTNQSNLALSNWQIYLLGIGADSTVTLGDGDDYVNVLGGGDTIDAGGGNNRLRASYGSDTAGLSFVYQDDGGSISNGTTFKNIQSATLYGGSGNDDFTVGGAGYSEVYGGGGVNSLDVNYDTQTTGSFAAINGDNFQGSFANATGTVYFYNIQKLSFTGSSADDSVSADGEPLNDPNASLTLDGGGGNDLLTFRMADFYGSWNGQTVFVAPNGGSAYAASGGYPADVQAYFSNFEGYDLTFNDENNSAYFGSNAVATAISSGLGLTLDGGGGTDTLTLDFRSLADGTTFDVSGNSVDSNRGTFTNFERFNLTLGNGANSVSLGAGDDNVTAGNGNDVIDGGGGNDTVSYANATSGVTVSLAAAGQQNTGGSGFDTLSNIENLIGANHDDVLTGNDGDNSLNGLIGIDTLYGMGGNDNLTATGGFLYGGAGNDFLYGYDGNIVLDGGNGDDTIYFDRDFGIGAGTASYADATAGVTVSLLLDSQQQNTIGAGRDTLTGISNLTGSDYNDTLTGDGGANVIDGGEGADKMSGGNGDDTYYVDDPGDNVVESSPTGGNDAIYSSVSYSLKNRYVETLTLTGTADIDATGNNQANTLIGNSGDNVLNGQGGADRMVGGDGDDTYYVDNAGDNVVEDSATGGNDRIFSSVSYSLANRYVETLTLTGTSNISATGNDNGNTLIGNSGSNALTGGAGNDILDGGDGADKLTGGDGNDTLDGGTGADKMTGGNGDDTYYVDDPSDNVVESSPTGGTDTIYSSVSYNLKNRYVETLTLTGTGDINAAGNGQINALIGNAGANVIEGGFGSDTLTGGAGADDFLFDSPLSAAHNVDAITDFTVGQDYITLDRAIFTAIAGDGPLDPAAFANDGKAHDGSDRIIYDPTSGNIFYDSNGSASGGRTQFAHVTPGTNLTAASFAAIG